MYLIIKVFPRLHSRWLKPRGLCRNKSYVYQTFHFYICTYGARWFSGTGTGTEQKSVG